LEIVFLDRIKRKKRKAGEGERKERRGEERKGEEGGE
jgi:hypothetical protein